MIAKRTIKRRFVEFIFRNFYPSDVKNHSEWFDSHPAGNPYPRSIRDEDSSRLDSHVILGLVMDSFSGREG